MHSDLAHSIADATVKEGADDPLDAMQDGFTCYSEAERRAVTLISVSEAALAATIRARASMYKKYGVGGSV